MSIHLKHLQYLATEIYKIKNCFSREIMKEVFIFQENENYNLWSGTHLTNRNIHTAYFGTDTITLNLSYGNLYQTKQKMLYHCQFSNLGLKYGPLITALVDSVKLLLKILVLLKSFQISNGIHNSYLQYVTISSQKLGVQTKELS